MMMIEAMRRAFGDTEFTATDAGYVLGARQPYSVLTRLKQAGVLERLGRGRYRFAPLAEPAVAPYLERLQIEESRRGREDTIAALASARWQDWLASGRLERLGPRRLRLNPATMEVEPLAIKRL